MSTSGPPSDWQPPGPPPPPPGYGAPPPGYGPYGGPPAGSPPSSYLVGAILSTLFCCVPFGIVSIVYAAQVTSKWNAGDFVGAQKSSERARLWMWIAIGCGIVALGLFFAAGGRTHSTTTYNSP